MTYTAPARYSPPKELKIGGIDAVVVDPHNEVFPFWYRHANGRRIPVLHIDHHPDIADTARTIESVFGNHVFDPVEYGKELHIGDFILASMHHGIAGPVYHINPRVDYIHAYGIMKEKRIIEIPSTRLEKNAWNGDEEIKGPVIYLDSRHKFPQKISAIQLFRQLRGYRKKLILDIDLDAFETVEDEQFGKPIEARIQVIDGRIDYVSRLLSRLSRPKLITVARSQSLGGKTLPSLQIADAGIHWGAGCFVDPELVDALEARVISKLDQIYARR